MAYVGGTTGDSCVFCGALHANDDPGRLILHRGESAFLILNLYPYNSGHAMAVPYQHAASLEELDDTSRAELIELATLFVTIARPVLRCHGFNLGLNLGSVAGAGVAEHVHVHIVPRWTGDANFMPILANTTVMPELLPVTYARLRAELERARATRAAPVTVTAGAVVVLPRTKQVVLRRARNGDIVLPKGHLEPGETMSQAAIREVREETGIDATIAGWAGISTFDTQRGDDVEHQLVAFFLAMGVETSDFAQHLNRDTLVVPIDDASRHLTYPDLQHIVESVTATLHALCDANVS
jgi:ATP adenylyltransferase